MRKPHKLTREMTLSGLDYCHTVLGCSYLTYEFGRYSADILGSDGKSLYEIEVKRTKNDLMHDFHKTKHQMYCEEDLNDLYTPNYFYFLVEDNLVPYAHNALEGMPYGLLAYSGFHPSNNYMRVREEKDAERVSKETTSKEVLSQMQRFMSKRVVYHYGESIV